MFPSEIYDDDLRPCTVVLMTHVWALRGRSLQFIFRPQVSLPRANSLYFSSLFPYTPIYLRPVIQFWLVITTVITIPITLVRSLLVPVQPVHHRPLRGGVGARSALYCQVILCEECAPFGCRQNGREPYYYTRNNSRRNSRSTRVVGRDHCAQFDQICCIASTTVIYLIKCYTCI